MLVANKTQNPGDFFAELCASRWDDVFLIDTQKKCEYSYGQFFNAALHCKAAFFMRGIKKGDTLCVSVHNSSDALILYCGALMADIRIALIDPLKGSKDAKDILDQVTYSAAIADDTVGFFDHPIRMSELVAEFQDKKSEREDVIAALRGIDAQPIFLITFTSGTTGLPKGVMHSFNNLFLSAVAFSGAFHFGKDNVFYHHLPMTYMAGILNSFVVPLISGSTLVIGPRFSVSEVARFWDLPSKHGVNVFWFVPTMLSLLMRLDRSKKGLAFGKKHQVIGCVATAPLSATLHTAFEKTYGIALYEGYGLSETLFNASQAPGAEGNAGSVGRVLPGTKAIIGNDGELILRTKWMCKGYLKERREYLFDTDEFASGDLAQIDKDGFLNIMGRKKDIIIRGGINISPRRLEELIDSEHLLEEHAVLGMQDDVLGERVVLFYTSRNKISEIQKRTLMEAVRSRLGREYAIDEFVALQEIPKNSNGKIDKLKMVVDYSRPKA